MVERLRQPDIGAVEARLPNLDRNQQGAHEPGAMTSTSLPSRMNTEEYGSAFAKGLFTSLLQGMAVMSLTA